MNNKMEPVTPVVILQGAMVFALLAGFAFGLFTGQAHVAGLAMAWLSLCGLFFTIAPVIEHDGQERLATKTMLATLADWSGSSLPSWQDGFDSRGPLQIKTPPDQGGVGTAGKTRCTTMIPQFPNLARQLTT